MLSSILNPPSSGQHRSSPKRMDLSLSENGHRQKDLESMKRPKASISSLDPETQKKKYRTLKRKYELLQQDNFELSERLAKARTRILKLRNERSYLLDEVSKFNESELNAEIDSDFEDISGHTAFGGRIPSRRKRDKTEQPVPSNPLALYRQEHLDSIKRLFPEASSRDLIKIVSLRWEQLGDDQKKAYYDKFDIVKAQGADNGGLAIPPPPTEM